MLATDAGKIETSQDMAERMTIYVDDNMQLILFCRRNNPWL